MQIESLGARAGYSSSNHADEDAFLPLLLHYGRLHGLRILLKMLRTPFIFSLGPWIVVGAAALPCGAEPPGLGRMWEPGGNGFAGALS